MPRPHRFVLPMVLGGLLLGVAARAEEEERGARVRALLAETVHGPMSPHFNSRDVLMTTLETRAVPEAGRDLYLPVLPPHCGLMQYGGPDAAEVRSLLARLFALYGYDLDPDVLVEIGGQSLRIDGLDADEKTGFALVPAPVGGARAPADVAPDARRWRRLRSGGHRVLVLPLDRFRSAQGDDFTPLLACALSAIEFLNDVTDGEDFDVRPLVAVERRETALGDPTRLTFPRAPSVPSEGALFFVATGKGHAEWRIDPEGSSFGGAGPPPEMLVLPFYWTPPPRSGPYDFSGPRPTFRLTQSAKGKTLRLESGRPLFLLPPTFDATRPYEIRIEGPAGHYHVGRSVTALLPARR